MEHDLAASAVSIGRHKSGGVGERAADGGRSAFNENARPRAASDKPSLVLASATVWTHTVVLTGALDHRSAHTLELEIERLCDEGVSGITLDLRELENVDSIGVAVIAFRCGLCERRGFDFGLIPGSPRIQRAFEQAGLARSLPFREDEVVSAPANEADTDPRPAVPSHDVHVNNPRRRSRRATVPR